MTQDELLTLQVRLDEESAEWLIQAARHHRPGGMGHVASELGRALDEAADARQTAGNDQETP